MINKQTFSDIYPCIYSRRGLWTTAKAAQDKTRQIRIQYVPPVNSEHQPLYEHLKQTRALERLQELLSPFRLPQPLLLKVSGCDGDANAWYEEGVVTVCYEFLQDILKNAPAQTLPSGVTQEDGILDRSSMYSCTRLAMRFLIYKKFLCSDEKKMRLICFLPISCCSLGRITLTA